MDVVATITSVAQVNWKLAEYLEQEGLNPYKLSLKVKPGRQNTVYRIARKGDDLKRIDFEVLADVLSALTEITGKPVTLTDLLEYEPD